MITVIERIESGNFWKFHGGVHPPEQKFLTNDKPIHILPLPSELILPLQQHIGQPGDLRVNVGDKILKGQQLTKQNNPMSVPIHAPTSGVVNAIKPSTLPHPSGLSELCLFIEPDGKEQWVERTPCDDFYSLSRENIVDKIVNAGIVGMGGAGFPTHIKVNTKPVINYLIINAAECEPYITSDDVLMREQSNVIANGIKILDHLLLPEYILIGIEDNKPEAIQALKQATKSIEKVKICVLPTKYPTGGEKQLIKALTGAEVPSGTLPVDLGIVMQNVATCFAIAEAIINDTPLIQRVVTVTGKALEKPQNVWSLLGTPVKFLLEQCIYKPKAQKNKRQIIMGGPMMGFSITNDNVPIIKTSNCLLVPAEYEVSSTNKEVDCIRCGKCADVCPSKLLPQELQWSAKAKDYPTLQKLNLFDCIDCGACAYVCPSQIPLVQYYRIAKAEIRQQQFLDNKAEKAKIRFEARKTRLEQEKLAREAKHKKAAEARRAAMNNKTPASENAKSAVAAALARVKKKKAEENNTKITSKPNDEQASTTAGVTIPSKTTDEKSQVAAAIARAKAKRMAVKQSSRDVTSKTSITEQKTETEHKSKQKDDQQASTTVHSDASKDVTSKTEQLNDKSSEAAKKDKIAGIVAKAKAKKEATLAKTTKTGDEPNQNIPPSIDTEEKPLAPDNKKIEIAAVIAKVKIRKESQLNHKNTNINNNTSNTEAAAKRAAVIAKIKAKKQQELESE